MLLSSKKTLSAFAVIFVAVCHVSVIVAATGNEPKIIDNGGLVANGSHNAKSLLRRIEFGGLERPSRPSYDRPNYGDLERPRPKPNDRPSQADDYERPRPSDRPSNHGSRGPQLISGTNLKTRTFYKLSMKRFPHGYVTWTTRKNFQTGHRYIQIDNNREHAHQYDRTGDLFRDAQWEFVPVSSDDRYRWYKLRNRGRPREYSTWSLTESISDYGQSNHLILDPNYPGRRPRTDFLFRPVLVKGHRVDGRDEKDYYQLKLKGNRRAVITYSKDTEYSAECYYLEVDNNNDERHMRRYEKGGDRFDDTLFSISLADREDIDDEEDIEDNNDDKYDDDEK